MTAIKTPVPLQAFRLGEKRGLLLPWITRFDGQTVG